MSKEAGINQKLKFLYLTNIFTEETDEDHTLTLYELSDRLEAEGINANRKTLTEDIELLRQFGMDIICEKQGKANGYYLGSRNFEITELKLLADAVSSSRFITERKSRQLLKKISALAGRYRGREIDRRVFIANRIKSENEQIYINVDAIQRAIDSRCMIRFRYFDYTLDKKKQFREGSRVCSPYALTWNDGNYYLIAHYEKYPQNLSNFRVDRMSGVELLTEKNVYDPDGFDLPGYMNTTFSMFSGNEESVKMRFDKKLINSVIDRFGTDVILVPDGEGHFTFTVKIKPGFAFYGWLFQFGTGAEIISPPGIRKEFSQLLENVMDKYK